MSFILIEFTYYFKHILTQYISVHLYKGPDFIPDRGPTIASPPLVVSVLEPPQGDVQVRRIEATRNVGRLLQLALDSAVEAVG